MANLKLFAELRYTDRIQACFRSEGPEGSSPAREGGEHRSYILEAQRAGINRGAPSALWS